MQITRLGIMELNCATRIATQRRGHRHKGSCRAADRAGIKIAMRTEIIPMTMSSPTRVKPTERIDFEENARLGLILKLIGSATRSIDLIGVSRRSAKRTCGPLFAADILFTDLRGRWLLFLQIFFECKLDCFRFGRFLPRAVSR